jgi:hypothetical protein
MNFLFSSRKGSEDDASTKSDMSSGSVAEQWQRRIYSLQSERCTPAMRVKYQEQQRAKEARKKRIETSCKNARRLETANYLSSASNMCTLQTFSSPATLNAPSEEIYKSSAAKTVKRAQKIQQSCSRRAVENYDNDDDEDEDLNELTEELHQEMQETAMATPDLMTTVQTFGHMTASQRAEATSSINDELLSLLKQLEVEPKDDAELTAKFSLFETFLQTVTVIRDQTFQFWEENQDLFEGGSKTAAQRELKKIDTEDCLGIIDDPRKWFVYAMTKKANENNVKIAQTLSLLRSRLEQINNEDIGECPFCLDDMAPLKAADQTIVLSCCHRVCKPCWQHWQDVKGPHAFCPLCRSDEFVSEVLSSPYVRDGL